MNHPVRNAFLVGGMIIALTVAGYAIFHKTNYSTNEHLPVVGSMSAEYGKKVYVRFARSDSEQELGLSGFETMPFNYGMLFLFTKQRIVPFWMKGMNFPLDMIWLRSNSAGHEDSYTVDSVTYNAEPSSYPESFQSVGPIDAVLEVNSGAAKQFGFEAGKTVILMKGLNPGRSMSPTPLEIKAFTPY